MNASYSYLIFRNNSQILVFALSGSSFYFPSNFFVIKSGAFLYKFQFLVFVFKCEFNEKKTNIVRSYL